MLLMLLLLFDVVGCVVGVVVDDTTLLFMVLHCTVCVFVVACIMQYYVGVVDDVDIRFTYALF